MDRGEARHIFKCLQCGEEVIEQGNFWGRVGKMIAQAEKIPCRKCGSPKIHYSEEVRYDWDDVSKNINEEKYLKLREEFLSKNSSHQD